MLYQNKGTGTQNCAVFELTGEVMSRFTNLAGGDFPINDWHKTCFSRQDRDLMVQFLDDLRELGREPLTLMAQSNFHLLDITVNIPTTPLIAQCLFMRTARQLPSLQVNGSIFLPVTDKPAIIAAVRFGKRPEVYLFALEQNEIDAIHLTCDAKKIENDVWFQCKINPVKG